MRSNSDIVSLRSLVVEQPIGPVSRYYNLGLVSQCISLMGYSIWSKLTIFGFRRRSFHIRRIWDHLPPIPVAAQSRARKVAKMSLLRPKVSILTPVCFARFPFLYCNAPCGWTQGCSDSIIWFLCFLAIILLTIPLLHFFCDDVVVACESDNKIRFIHALFYRSKSFV